jgi:hypothetical protein
VTPAGQYTVLYTVTKQTGDFIWDLIEGADGDLYGTAGGRGYGPSLLFRVTTAGKYSIIRGLNESTDGECTCLLRQGSNGIIYSDATGGGPSGGGTIFALDMGLPVPAPRAMEFRPAKGAAGAQVRIWGSNLFNATVQFNGAAATTVSNSGPNYLFATVPAGSTSGPITVTTPGGTSTTPGTFTVQ